MKLRLRDGTGSREYRHLIEDVDRHGNVRIYFRRKGQPKVRLTATPGTPAFDAEYQRAFTGDAKPIQVVAQADKGSLRWLCGEYFASAAFRQLGTETRKARRKILEEICSLAGNASVAAWEPRHVAKLRDRRASSPAAANEIVKSLRQLFAWASSPEYGHMFGNPAMRVSYLGSRNPDGWQSWGLSDVTKYTATHSTGSKERLALDLLLFTGVRRSDVIRLGPQMESGGYLVFTETKGRAKLRKAHKLPILPALRESINATPTGKLAYLTDSRGNPWHRAKSFSQWFERACRKAGIDKGLSAHGLRKLGAQLCAEGGATEHQLMALFGWESPKQAAHYTRKANRALLEADAAALLQNKIVPLSSKISKVGHHEPRN